MHQTFNHKVSKIQGITVPKHVLCNIYTELTGDASQDQNKEIHKCMRQAIIGEHPNLVVDLRHLNKGRPGDTFKVFFDTMETKIDEICAADERRHVVVHLSNFISSRDLIEQITKDCPTGTPIPSEATILFAFTPKNGYIKTTKSYKSQFKLKVKVQSRQLRASHVDDHYCAGQFHYMR